MNASAHILALLLTLLPRLPHATAYARTLDRAIRQEDPRWAPSPEEVVAVLYLESRGQPHACANDRWGGSARGLMQIRRPRSRCPRGKERFLDPLFDETTNLRTGVHLLAVLKQFEHQQHHDQHSIFFHYSGGSRMYEGRVNALRRRLL